MEPILDFNKKEKFVRLRVYFDQYGFDKTYCILEYTIDDPDRIERVYQRRIDGTDKYYEIINFLSSHKLYEPVLFFDYWTGKQRESLCDIYDHSIFKLPGRLANNARDAVLDKRQKIKEAIERAQDDFAHSISEYKSKKHYRDKLLSGPQNGRRAQHIREELIRDIERRKQSRKRALKITISFIASIAILSATLSTYKLTERTQLSQSPIIRWENHDSSDRYNLHLSQHDNFIIENYPRFERVFLDYMNENYENITRSDGYFLINYIDNIVKGNLNYGDESMMTYSLKHRNFTEENTANRNILFELLFEIEPDMEIHYGGTRNLYNENKMYDFCKKWCNRILLADSNYYSNYSNYINNGGKYEWENVMSFMDCSPIVKYIVYSYTYNAACDSNFAFKYKDAAIIWNNSTPTHLEVISKLGELKSRYVNNVIQKCKGNVEEQSKNK